jgi:hypothetical protein
VAIAQKHLVVDVGTSAMLNSFHHKLVAALRLQPLVFLLYLLFMVTFSNEPISVRLPLDLAFGIGIFVVTGLIVYTGTLGTQQQGHPCSNCRQRGFCADTEQTCPRIHRSATAIQPEE